MRIAIIGSGSAAFACALHAAEKNAQVTLIESGTIGGTCVNVGCVPSKIFIRAAHIAHLQHQHPFEGLKKYPIDVNRQVQVKQQQHQVDFLRHEKYENLIADNKINLIHGAARFKDPETLTITTPDGNEHPLAFDRTLIASGALPSIPPTPGLQETPYWTSTEALSSNIIPNHLIILGGSSVGLEIGQAFLREGAKVTVIDVSNLLPKEDPDIGTHLKTYLEKEGMQILTHTKSEKISHDGKFFHLHLPDQTISGDQLLVATGRKPNTQQLNLELIGVEADPHGAVVIDEYMRTNLKHIYAAGDCTPLPQFVYVAAAAGTRAAINMLGGKAPLNLSVMPAVTFTDPQVASVGLTESLASQQGIDVETRLLTLDNVPRAIVNFDTQGFIKLVAEKQTGKLIGAQILAADAGEIIQTAALAIHHQMTIRELAEQLFPYLTMAEGIKLCAQTFFQDVKKLSCCAGG